MVNLYVYITVDSKTYRVEENLHKIQFSGQDRSDTSLPSWGIKSNSGTIEFVDKENIVKTMGSQIHNATIRIYLNRKTIGTFYVIDAQNEESTNISKVSFQDKLKDLSKPKSLGVELKQNITAYSFFTYITMQVGGVGTADEDTINHLKSINIPYAYLNEGSYWNMLAKFCELTMCYVYCNENGYIHIKYNGGK